jgi:S1-C subfamily serine protease
MFSIPCRWALTAAFVALAFAGGNLAATQADPKDERTDAVYRTAVRATAFILTEKLSGTGVVIDAERRLVVTNYHVVLKEEKVNVIFPILKDGLPTGDRDYYWKNWKKLAITGKVIVRDPGHDLAIIELESLPEGVKAVRLARQPAKVGDWTLMIGGAAADAQPWRTLPGVVKKADRHSNTDPKTKQKVDARMVRTEVACLPGDSGSPVLNGRGELVAIHHGGHTCSIDVRELQALLPKAGHH